MEIKNWIRRKLKLPMRYPSETNKVRHLVVNYCIGKGCDVGFGGNKIKENCDGIDYEVPYANTGKDKSGYPMQGWCRKDPCLENTYDYVYSSHLIEDFEDTPGILCDFIEFLKSGGNLILFFRINLHMRTL